MTAGVGHPFLRCLAAWLVVLALPACNMTPGLVGSPRTPIEQLLLTQSLLRTLDQVTLPLRPGDSVVIETAWPPTHQDFAGDLPFAASVLASWCTQQGLIIGGDHPGYRMRVLLHAFGLDKKDTFVGVPPIQSLLLPIALPELTLYRNVLNRGYTRLTIDITDASTGRLVGFPLLAEASVRQELVTLLFLLSWKSSDLIPPAL